MSNKIVNDLDAQSSFLVKNLPTPTSSGDSANKGYVDGKVAPLQNTSEKGVANGYASLDGTGKVPTSQLPSYVDDVVEYTDYASLPVTGETGKIYVTLNDNKVYRWSGSSYVNIVNGSLLNDLSDVTVSGAVDGAILYKSNSGEWLASQDLLWNPTSKTLSSTKISLNGKDLSGYIIAMSVAL